MKEPDFGKHFVEHEGVTLSCDYKVPGLTLHDLVMIYDRATKEAKPGDEYAASPAKWPTVRGVEAVTNAILEAFGYATSK